MHSFINSFIHSITHTFAYLIHPSLPHSLAHSPTRPLIHTPTHYIDRLLFIQLRLPSLVLEPCVGWCGRFARLFLPDLNVGGPQHNLKVTIMVLLDVFYCLNSTFNFFVYYVMGSRFRVTLWGLLGRKGRKAASKEMTMSSSFRDTQI